MKKLFFALALTGIVGLASVNTVSAITNSKVVVNVVGDEKKDKDKKDCKKDGKCSMGERKCCHSKDAKATDATEKTDTKKTEEKK